jgi:hypothetical protein
MKSIAITLFFLGIILIVNGYYKNKIKNMKHEQKYKYKYRFIPRSYYDEQLQHNDIDKQFNSMFNEDTPWHQRNVGVFSKNKK